MSEAAQAGGLGTPWNVYLTSDGSMVYPRGVGKFRGVVVAVAGQWSFPFLEG